MIQANYNPDVLTCLANLSNDEVFTPPSLVNEILDSLPEELWKNKETKVLDPVSKTGVFLREVAKRLMTGLENEIPDRQARINHIFKNQLYGIAITELTSLLSRRSVYCSKLANGKYSICEVFEDEKGNIIYDRIEHTWLNGNCKFCGASKEVYARNDTLETHAYQFIHTNEPESFFNNMRFDVIVGNPPYQLSDGGAQQSASPIYNKFVEQAIKLNPRFLTMIIPARWYSGGKGLDDFRSKMLNDERISEIHDFPDTSDCFPGLNIRGGICYFLWDKEHKGLCKVTTHKNGNKSETIERPLLEKGSEVFIRYNQAISILHKVKEYKEESFSNIVSPRKPFGLATNFDQFSKIKNSEKDIFLYRFGDSGYIRRDQVVKNKGWIEEFKVIVPYASPGDDSYPHLILSKPKVSEPFSVCTETYLIIGPFKDIEISKNVISYMRTRFFRFMVLLIKNTQHITKNTYTFAPKQNFNESWTDDKLYEKYKLTKEEIEFIESMVRPMA